ncbi:MAG: hypothetical protein ABJG78_01330 [Cyclobacteriaceae bacterium]
MIRKILRFFGLLLLGLVGLAAIGYVIIDKPVPNGTLGQDAEQLADEVLEALNKPGFDSLEYIEFTFRNTNRYKWDRSNNSVIANWEEQEVYLDLNRPMDSYSLLEFKAYQNFINDSFWLIAPFKLRDEGVIRSTVVVGNGRGLLVTYSSGGLTPGDSYLWVIDENGFPKSWKLWTSNIPIGGLELGWSGWVNKNDVWFSTVHEGKFTTVPVEVHSVR